jgi:hypothetical protein
MESALRLMKIAGQQDVAVNLVGSAMKKTRSGQVAGQAAPQVLTHTTTHSI